MVYIILGMHKSGTTMLSEILHKSGINMGDFDESIDYYGGQKYEREDTSHAIWDVLDCREQHSLDTFPPFDQRTKQRELPALTTLIGRYNQQYTHWGFKEPRSLFVYEDIKSDLGEHKVVCVFRDLKDVVIHYLQFSGPNLKIMLKVIRAWKLYNEEMLRVIDRHQDDTELMLCNYKSFVADPQSVRILSDFVGRELVDVRKPRAKKKRSPKYLVYQRMAQAILLFNVYDWKSTDRQTKKVRARVAVGA